MRAAINQWLATPGDASSKAGIAEDLRTIRTSSGYQNVVLVGTDGRVLISADPALAELEAPARALVAQAASSGAVAFGDLFRSPADGKVRLDVAAPVLGADDRPAAVLILRCDPEDYLYPLMRSWPTASKSAEALLLRRDGDDAVFLSPLRYRPDPVLTVRVPLSQGSLPAVQAIRGKVGQVEAPDYRGVEVLVDLRPVPGSPWFVETKVDAEEILAEARYRDRVVLLFVVLSITMTAAMAALVSSYRRRRLYEDLVRTEQEQQAAVRRAAAYNRSLIEASPDPLVTIGPDGTITDVNQATENVTGRPRKEMIGRDFSDFLTDPEAGQAGYRRALEQGSLRDYPLEIKHRDGHTTPVLYNASVYRDEEGQVAGVFAAARDITKSKRADEALRESEARYRTLFEGAAEGILVADVHTRQFIYANPAVCKMFGHTQEELARLGMAGIVPKEALDAAFADFDVMARGERTASLEAPFLRGDGAVFYADIISAPMVLNGRECNVGFFTDVTERKQAVEALRQNEAKFRAIVENIGIGVALISPDMQVLELNRQMREWFPNVNPGDCPVCYRVFNNPPREQICDYCPTWKTLQDGEVHEATTRTPTARGPRSYRVVASPVRDAQGKVAAAIEMVEDITERLSLEEQFRQAQKMEAVGQLAGGVAHDFNNVLTGIRGLAGFARDETKIGSQSYRDLGEVLELTDRAAALTRQLLAFSRRQPLEPVVLDVNALIRDHASMLTRLVGEHVALMFLPAADLGSVRADPGQIEQVIMNLAINSRDAMPAGGQLTIETANVELGAEYALDHAGVAVGPYVMIAVSDTGCGMDAATQQHIFEPFFTTKEVGKGTGLGLSTVYGIVKQHGGHIWVYSELGKGATFKVYLPRVAEEPEALRPPSHLIVGGTETILLVEDNAAIRDVCRRHLEQLGYTVLAVANAAEAEEAAARHPGPIGLLLTDVVMPVHSGKELYESLAAKRAGLKVLYMSGYTDNAIVHHGVLDKGIAFLQKPFEREALAIKVRQALDGQ
jgi:PAS domain S-box-containing protein